MGVLAKALNLIADVALPGGCWHCGTHLPAGEGPWCTTCGLALGGIAQTPFCPRCGLTTDAPAELADGCIRCQTHPIRVDGFARVGEYDGLLRTIICKYKFARQQYLDRPLSLLLAPRIELQPWACELDALVPVPTSWRSRIDYGFSPAGLLARQLEQVLHLPALHLLCERGKRRRQVGLSFEDRRRNVRGAFRLRRGARPAGGVFCVVDDVSTTTSTVQEIARMLKEAGALRVYAAVVARTNPERAHSLRA